MHIQKVKEIIESYKKNFQAISKQEIYKWRAVKRFQDNWNIAARDFVEMLENSLSLSRNLLSSGNYFPQRMLILSARREPETVRNLFIELYDEEEDLVERLENFQAGIALLNGRYFAKKKVLFLQIQNVQGFY
jgi:hypothetical protein